MIIYDLNIKRVALSPIKTDAPLIVNALAPLTLPIPTKFFKTIRRRDSEICYLDGAVQHTKLPQCNLLHIRRKSPRPFAIKDFLRLFAPEAAYHQ
jgi:hypothetical protein